MSHGSKTSGSSGRRSRPLEIAFAGILLLALGAMLGPRAHAITFEAAVLDYQSGLKERGLAKLEQLATQGDARAQYYLGIELVKGTSGQTDLARGYAWLQVAAQPYVGSYGASAVDEARAAVAKVGPMLSGKDLIRADQIAGTFLTERNQIAQRQLARALAAILATDPVAAAERQRGCAIDRSLKDCPPAPPADDQTTACTGDVATPDKPPSVRGPDAIVRKPAYPRSALRTAEEGSVVYVVHVDRSGDVCYAVIAMGSGNEAIDRSTLDTVRIWRFQPALKDGRAVEAVEHGKIEFGLTDFKVGEK